MKNWKTTLSAILGLAGQIAPVLGAPVEIGQAVSTLGIFLIGLFARDGHKEQVGG